MAETLAPGVRQLPADMVMTFPMPGIPPPPSPLTLIGVTQLMAFVHYMYSISALRWVEWRLRGKLFEDAPSEQMPSSA